MSKLHKPKGLASPIGSVTLCARQSRHGRPMAEVFKRPPTTERRVIENKLTGLVEVQHVVVGEARAMTPEEIQAARDRVKRALRSTCNYGKPNGGTK